MPPTTQQIVSPIHPTLTNSKIKNAAFPQTTIQSTVKPSVIPKYSQIDYQTFEPVTTTRQTKNESTFDRNIFSDHNSNFFANSKTTKSPYINSQSQSQTQKYNRNVPQQASHTVFFNNQPQATLHRSAVYPFSSKTKTKKHHIRNQLHCSEDEKYYNQNQQRFNTNQQNNNWNIDQPDTIYQPDLFEPNTPNEQTPQTRHNPTSYNNNFQPQNSGNIQSYQPTQMQNKIQLPNYLQQHEITKTQLFSNTKKRSTTTDNYESIPILWVDLLYLQISN